MRLSSDLRTARVCPHRPSAQVYALADSRSVGIVLAPFEALVDTGAQAGIIGQSSLARVEAYLTNLGLRV